MGSDIEKQRAAALADVTKQELHLRAFDQAVQDHHPVGPGREVDEKARSFALYDSVSLRRSEPGAPLSDARDESLEDWDARVMHGMNHQEATLTSRAARQKRDFIGRGRAATRGLFRLHLGGWDAQIV